MDGALDDKYTINLGMYVCMLVYVLDIKTHMVRGTNM